MSEYEVKGKTTKIQATSRCAIKIRDNFYTTELVEERVLPNDDSVRLDLEYKALFDSINAEIDNQMKDILTTFK